MLDGLDSCNSIGCIQIVVLKGYAHWLRNEPVVFADLYDEYINYENIQIKMKAQADSLFIIESDSIAEINFDRFEVNDTLILVFPIESYSPCKAVFRPPFPSEDVLSIKAVLKRKALLVDTVDGSRINSCWFDLRITWLTHEPCRLMFDDLSKGSELGLDVGAYRRIITRPSQGEPRLAR